MTDRRRLVVFSHEVGVIIDATEPEAADEIASARRFLDKITGSSPVAQAVPNRKPQSGTLPSRILGLADDYFAQPKESTEVTKDLARAAHHYEDVRVRVELSRLVKRGRLRRVGDGTKSSPYKYVNR